MDRVGVGDHSKHHVSWNGEQGVIGRYGGHYLLAYIDDNVVEYRRARIRMYKPAPSNRRAVNAPHKSHKVTSTLPQRSETGGLPVLAWGPVADIVIATGDEVHSTRIDLTEDDNPATYPLSGMYHKHSMDTCMPSDAEALLRLVLVAVEAV